MKDISGKTAVVTGAASGIGRAIALSLAEAGASLCLVDINATALSRVADECRSRGVSVTSKVTDLADEKAVTELVAQIIAEGGVDILVNGAGIVYVGTTEDMTAAQWDSITNVNLKAPLRLTVGLLPSLLSRPESHILNVASFGGLVEHWNEVAYCMTKHALVAFSQSLRMEYADRGLGVTALCPGLVRTNLLTLAPEGVDTAFPEHLEKLRTTSEKVAIAAMTAIRENQGTVVVGLPPHLLWLLKRVSPKLADGLHIWLMDRMRTDMARQAASRLPA